MGWGKLKSGGLWTPTGTILLRRAEDDDDEEDKGKRTNSDWVLRTSVSDESDGILSMSVKWDYGGEVWGSGRGAASLPPGWGRVQQPEKGTLSEEVENVGLSGRVEDLRSILKAANRSESFRFRVKNNAITEVLWEHRNIETNGVSELWQNLYGTNAATWFTCAASALTQRKESRGGLWGFEIPPQTLDFARRDSMPCGVMVLLGVIAEIDTPPWSTASEEDENRQSTNRALKHHARFQKEIREMQLEKSMPEAQARVARSNRISEKFDQMREDMAADQLARVEKEERRINDAIASPKLSNKALAEACLGWLINKGEVGREWTVSTLAEAVLYLMVVDQRSDGETAKIVAVLEEWKGWVENGSIKRIHIRSLEDKKVEFCFAAALIAVIQEAAASSGKAGVDMIECLRLWRKVRLG